MKKELTGRQQSLIMIALCFSSFPTMFVIVGSAVFTAAVASELNGLAFYSLCFTLEALARSIAIVISGKMGDLIGRKKIYLYGVVGYMIAAVVCGVAPSMIIFIIGRILTGLAWGLFYTNTFTLLSDIYGDDKRTKMLGYLQSLNTVAMIVSPLACGALVDVASWRFVFFLSVPFLLIAAALVLKIMPDMQSNQQTVVIDKGGIVYTALAVCALTFALSFGGVFFDWISLPILGLLAALILFVILLVRKEKSFSEPLFPMQLFTNKNYLIVTAASFLFVFVSLTGNYLILFMEKFLGASPTVSGTFLMIPNILAVLLSAYLGVFLSKHTNKNKLVMLAFSVSTFIATLLFFTFGTGTSYFILTLTLLFLGLCTGINNVFPMAYAQTALPGEMIGSGTAFVGFAQGLANSVGMAVFGLISAFGLEYIFKSTVVLSVIMLLLVLFGLKENKVTSVNES